ncbi:hypothetical protein, partial [Verminephrobacter aporrectodeae]|uniref:hypothetical protein n=1 Tax=Verminephrobacter aporrectodeae TaxID=1110389 RepID=UPI001F40F9C2
MTSALRPSCHDIKITVLQNSTQQFRVNTTESTKIFSQDVITMNPDIYIGIDMGSTGLKAVAF